MLCSIPIFIVLMILGATQLFDVNPDYPFLVIAFLYFPCFLFQMILKFPNSYGDLRWLIVGCLFSLLIESITYTMQEYYWDGKTIGKSSLKIKVNHGTFLKMYTRNLLKVISKYFFIITLILVLLDKKKHTIYDKITHLNVVRT